MAKKLYIASQAPFVELPVESKEDAIGNKGKILVGFKQYNATEAVAKLEAFKDLTDEAVDAALRKEILYIKNAEIKVYDDETFELVETIKVDDTRQATSLEPFWSDKDSCLAVLLDSYFASFPWKGSFIETFIKSLYNISFKESEVKNS